MALDETSGSVTPILLESDSRKERLKELTERLEQGVKDVFESKRYKEYLQVMSKFHSYSFNNTLLIAMQMPSATHVAGFSSWKNKFHRSVKRGETGIRIIAPAPYKIEEKMTATDPDTDITKLDENGEPEEVTVTRTVPCFKVVSVFDVSQTEGKELPKYMESELSGDVADYEAMLWAITETSPVPVDYEDITNGANGYYSPNENRIAVKNGMSQMQTVKTLIHEVAHSMLHSKEALKERDIHPSRYEREVQAESVAFVVCSRYGIDTSDYSFGYVAGWSSGREVKELKDSLETIRSTAHTIIEGIDSALEKAREAALPEKETPKKKRDRGEER